MRYSKGLFPTLKETPAEAQAASHKLMIRAGMIRKLQSGAYSYLPLGFRALQKVKQIIRQEMEAIGAQEVLLPALQPVELWKKTGRYETLGEDMIKFIDRHGKENVLGPTHEEVITHLIANEIRSYRQLPITLYQIQTKFRDETRPRFGVIRSREFIMKDAYSFNKTEKDLDLDYQKMYQAYNNIFQRSGLDTLAVEADTGVMGGDVSHEYMVLAESGEDKVLWCPACKYSASIEVAGCLDNTDEADDKGQEEVKEVATPGETTVEKIAKLLKKKPVNLIKTMVVLVDDKPVVALVRGDGELNLGKLRSYLKANSIEMADETVIKKVTAGPIGFSGPVGLKGVKIIADYQLRGMKNAVTGANKKDAHLTGVNIKRDFTPTDYADLRYITKDDPCPKCQAKKATIKNAIELGHLFKLGTKYTKSLGATYLGENGKSQDIIMGCYGIGVNRIIASVIEINHDEAGIIWPIEIAPYQVALVSLAKGEDKVREVAEAIYQELLAAGIEVLYDDRDERPGVKLKDADLIGLPLRITIGERNLAEGKIELKLRSSKDTQLISIKDVSLEAKKALDSLA